MFELIYMYVISGRKNGHQARNWLSPEIAEHRYGVKSISFKDTDRQIQQQN